MAMKKQFVDNGREATTEELPAIRKWFRAAIPVLRKANNKARGQSDDTYRGVHVVFGGLNAQFGTKFPNHSARKVMKQLEVEQFLAVIPVRGGAMVYLWADKPDSYRGPMPDRDDLQSAIDRQLALLDADELLATDLSNGNDHNNGDDHDEGNDEIPTETHPEPATE